MAMLAASFVVSFVASFPADYVKYRVVTKSFPTVISVWLGRNRALHGLGE